MRALVTSALARIAVAILAGGNLSAQTPSPNDPDFVSKARKLRESALQKLDPQGSVPRGAHPRSFGRYPWKLNIVTTVFWVGSADGRKKGNAASSWDPDWQKHFGGFDNPAPEKRHEFIPTSFVPRLNPFYIALPYNDVANGATKSEAKTVIPWFKDAFVQDGQSVCRNRWVAIRNAAGKVCFAQWSDCGPFRVDHWQYVFGFEKPKPNLNEGAGLNVSPAVRDYLGLSGTDVTDWKFVDLQEVPAGPWALYGENNSLLLEKRRIEEPVPTTPPPPATKSDSPTEIPSPGAKRPADER